MPPRVHISSTNDPKEAEPNPILVMFSARAAFRLVIYIQTSLAITIWLHLIVINIVVISGTLSITWQYSSFDGSASLQEDIRQDGRIKTRSGFATSYISLD